MVLGEVSLRVFRVSTHARGSPVPVLTDQAPWRDQGGGAAGRNLISGVCVLRQKRLENCTVFGQTLFPMSFLRLNQNHSHHTHVIWLAPQMIFATEVVIGSLHNVLTHFDGVPGAEARAVRACLSQIICA